MAEYIEKDATIERLEKLFQLQASTARAIIEAIPAADVVPVRHGEWFVSIGKDGEIVGTICPICGFAWSEAIDAVKLEPRFSLIKTPYCPNCGAKMDKEEE